MSDTWIRDDAFIRGNIPMTKFAVRAVTMALLDIAPGKVLLDIGAGTGRLAIPLARRGVELACVEPSAAMCRKFLRKLAAAPDAAGRITLIDPKGDIIELQWWTFS